MTNLRSALEDVNVQLTKSQTNRLVRMINLGQNGAIDCESLACFSLGRKQWGAVSGTHSG